MARFTLSLLSVLLAVLGLTVLGAAWFPRTIVASLPQVGAVGLNSALGFLFFGIALSMPARREAGILLRSFLGIAVVFLGGMVLLQLGLGWYPAKDSMFRHFLNSGAHHSMGAMGWSTALAFLLCGTMLAAMDRLRLGAGLLLQLLACLAVVAGGLILIDCALEHALFDQRNAIYRMASPLDAAGICLLGAGTLLCSFDTPWARAFYVGKEDRQVFVLSVVLVFSTVLISGLSVSYILARNYVDSFQDILRAGHRANTLLFRHALDSAALQTMTLLREAELSRFLDPAATAPVAALSEAVGELTRSGAGSAFSAVEVIGQDGRPLVSGGAVDAPVDLRVAVEEGQSWLIWRDGWVLQTRLSLLRGGRQVGTVIADKAIEPLQTQFDYMQQLGRTGEVLACVAEAARMACFPSRLVQHVHRQSFEYGGELIPMGRALHGQEGVATTRDYRGVTVVSAYGAIPGTPLGLVQKIDASDLSASIGKYLWPAILLLFLFSLGGALLLARTVRPIVQALVGARKQLAAMFDNVPSAILTTAAGGRIESVNRAATAMFQTTEQNLVGQSIDRLFPAIGRIALPAADDPPGYHRVPLQGRRSDGSIFPAEVGVGSLVLDGRLQAIYVARDMSALQAAKAGLRESERRLEGIAGNIPGVVFQLHRRAGERWPRVTYVSSAVGGMFGIDAATVQAHPDAFLVRLVAEGQQEFEAAMEHSARELTQWNWEGRLGMHNGRDMWLNLRAKPRRAADGDVTWDGVIFNISASKHTEEELRKTSATLRELSAHVEETREQERKRIAREVHDEMGQTLTALRMEIALLRLDLEGHELEAERRLHSMKALVDRAIKTTRDVTALLRPPALDLGIAAALEWLAAGFSSNTGVPCRLTMSDSDIRLDEHREIAVFRIVQEALTNVARHAQASSVEVTIRQDAERLVVTVSDDGKGFDFAQAGKVHSFGLIGIRERVLSLSGAVAIDSVQGGGTRLRVEIPLQAEATAALEPVASPSRPDADEQVENTL